MGTSTIALSLARPLIIANEERLARSPARPFARSSYLRNNYAARRVGKEERELRLDRCSENYFAVVVVVIQDQEERNGHRPISIYGVSIFADGKL